MAYLSEDFLHSLNASNPHKKFQVDDYICTDWVSILWLWKCTKNLQMAWVMLISVFQNSQLGPSHKAVAYNGKFSLLSVYVLAFSMAHNSESFF